MTTRVSEKPAQFYCCLLANPWGGSSDHNCLKLELWSLLMIKYSQWEFSSSFIACHHDHRHHPHGCRTFWGSVSHLALITFDDHHQYLTCPASLPSLNQSAPLLFLICSISINKTMMMIIIKIIMNKNEKVTRWQSSRCRSRAALWRPSQFPPERTCKGPLSIVLMLRIFVAKLC